MIFLQQFCDYFRYTCRLKYTSKQGVADTLPDRGQLFIDYFGGVSVRTNMGSGQKAGTRGQGQDVSRTCPGLLQLRKMTQGMCFLVKPHMSSLRGQFLCFSVQNCPFANTHEYLQLNCFPSSRTQKSCYQGTARNTRNTRLHTKSFRREEFRSARSNFVSSIFTSFNNFPNNARTKLDTAYSDLPC